MFRDSAAHRILQPGRGPIRSSTYLPADPAAVFWGRLPCATDAAVLEIDAGTEVTIDTLSHEGVLDDQGSDPRAFFAKHGVDAEAVLEDAVALTATRSHSRDAATDGPHVITGPIAVRDARPGDLLAMTIVELLPRVPYGIISNRHGRGALPGEYPRGDSTVSIFAAVDDPSRAPVAHTGPSSADGTGRSGQLVTATTPTATTPTATMARTAGGDATVTFPLAPFLGTMGVAVAGGERPHSVPPGRHGGNIDIKLLTVGSTLYLPVQVDGALAYVGDPHFAQGDGEVALTALEASLRATVRFDVVPAADPLAVFAATHGPVAESFDYWIPTGLDEDLREAMKAAVRAAIALLETRYGMDAEHAYAYLSAATDFDISQVVDRTCGVHARIRKADFA